MKKFFWLTCLLLISLNAYSAPITIEPELTLQPESGPFGFGGRGVVFRAEQNFTMTSFGMDLRFDGTLDFRVAVYAVDGDTRGSLISETAYPGIADDDSAFFALAHTESFTAGTSYEILMRFSDPGVIFPHYDFSNSPSNPGGGFMAGTEMLILDGSDFDTAGFNNSWLGHFQLDGDSVISVESTEAVPTLGIYGLLLLILGTFTIAALNRKTQSSRT
jgi:hypothetical protein